MTSNPNVESLLVVEVGSITTRAILFEVVDEQYRFLGAGVSPTTAIAPYRNISEGVRMALDNLQTITSRSLIDARQQLIIPAQPDGSGVDRFAATISVGEPLKVVVVGLLEDVSLESAIRLAQSTYTRLIQTISLNDKRKTDARMNMLIRARPDLILVAGGTDGGASQSVLALLESVGLACYMLPEDQRPDVLFVGNQSLTDEVKSLLEGHANLHFTANIRPTLEGEQLDASRTAFAHLYAQLRMKQIHGLEELKAWSSDALYPSAFAFSRVIRFLSKVLNTKKSVMGLDVGASATTLVTAWNSELSLHVFPQFGLGSPSLATLLERVAPGDILRWITTDLTREQLQEYLITKSLYPHSLPGSAEEMVIEQAIARVMIQSALKQAAPEFPRGLSYLGDGNIPLVEPILATGGILANAPSPAHSALLLLDGLQPVGVTTLILDQNHIAPALGAAATFNQLLAVQVMDSNSFLNLGTVIAPVVNAKFGWPILRAKMTYENGQETNFEVKQGSLEVLPLPYGQTARLQLHPLHKADVGMGLPGRGGGFTVKGGVLGVVIDGRGRPIALPKDLAQRQELNRKWLLNLGGQ